MQQLQAEIDGKNARLWAVLSIPTIIVLITLVALYIWVNFGGERLNVIIVGGIAVMFVVAIFPAVVGWTNRKFSFGVGIWGTFMLISIVFLALGGWINFNSEYIKGEIATSSYITIQYGKEGSTTYILHTSGEFGTVNANTRFEAVGSIGDSTITLNGVVYQLLGFEFIVKSSVLAIGVQPPLLIEFNS